MTRFVYVIGPAGGPYKVGVATDPEHRLATLQTGFPSKLMLHQAHPHQHAMHVEQVTHETLSDKRLAGEWFSATLDEIAEAIEMAVNSPLPLPKGPKTQGIPNANRLHEWRRGRRLTQFQAARTIGCSLRLWQYWESGERAVPKMAEYAMLWLDREAAKAREYAP